MAKEYNFFIDFIPDCEPNLGKKINDKNEITIRTMKNDTDEISS